MTVAELMAALIKEDKTKTVLIAVDFRSDDIATVKEDSNNKYVVIGN